MGKAKSSRCQDRTTKRNKDQINGQKIQDVKIAPLNGPKNDQISRLQPPKSSRNYSCSPELPVSRSQPLNGPKVQISKKIATINERRKHFHHFCIGITLKPAYRLSVSVCSHFTGWETSPSHHFLPRKWSSLLAWMWWVMCYWKKIEGKKREGRLFIWEKNQCNDVIMI